VSARETGVHASCACPPAERSGANTGSPRPALPSGGRPRHQPLCDTTTSFATSATRSVLEPVDSASLSITSSPVTTRSATLAGRTSECSVRPRNSQRLRQRRSPPGSSMNSSPRATRPTVAEASRHPEATGKSTAPSFPEGSMRMLETRVLPEQMDARAPDGSGVRLLLGVPGRGGMARRCNDWIFNSLRCC
jgi:hypothetical protein